MKLPGKWFLADGLIPSDNEELCLHQNNTGLNNYVYFYCKKWTNRVVICVKMGNTTSFGPCEATGNDHIFQGGSRVSTFLVMASILDLIILKPEICVNWTPYSLLPHSDNSVYIW